MHKKLLPTLLLAATCLISFSSNAQLNLTLLGTLDYQNLHNSEVSDIWGYVDQSGNEYSIIGFNEGGVSIVDVTNPASPSEVFNTGMAPSIWYDIKTWGDYAYITTEGGGGMTIVDMSGLPGNTNLPVTTYDYSNAPGAVNSAHNLYIDENGVCYIFGSDRGNGGTIFLDVATNPMSPIEIGEFDDWYAHDGVVRGDTLYGAHINDGWFSIVDISDKQNPIVLGTQITPSVFAHNIWMSDDCDHVYTNEEVSAAYITAYDITDPTDIKETDRTQSSPGSGVIPHNTHFLNEYVITSYYRDGVTIHDVSDPSNMIEVGNYDTSPLSGNNFNGAWGAYPYLPSGNLLVSDIEGGLFVFSVNYQRGCYLEGTVTDAVTTMPINAISVEILGSTIADATDISGDYATGIATAGTYDIAYSKPGYYPDTAYNVVLTSGSLVIQNMVLTPLPSFTLIGQVNEIGGSGIAGAQVVINDNNFTYTAVTNATGGFTITPVYDGTYDFVAGSWGHYSKCETGVSINSTNSTLTIDLGKGYYDDFSFNFGWTATGDASTGMWERAEPNGTFFGGSAAAQPDEDVQLDCLDQAMITGNAGQNAGSNDVDDGSVVLTSPVMDLAGMTDPYIHFSAWFFNAGGSINPNDSLTILLSDGTNTAVVNSVEGGDANSQGGWYTVSVPVSSLSNITVGANMQLTVRTSDIGNQMGHIVEAAFDYFYITEGPNSVQDVEDLALAAKVYPNPSTLNATAEWKFGATEEAASLKVYSLSGQLMDQMALTGQEGKAQLSNNLQAGMYIVIIQGNLGSTTTLKWSKL